MAILDSGEYSSAADLAYKLAVSSARVSQVLRQLQPSPEVLDRIAAPGDPLPGPILTERNLRPIIGLFQEELQYWIETLLDQCQDLWK